MSIELEQTLKKLERLRTRVKVRAEFRCSSSTVTPSRISECLGFIPDRSGLKGGTVQVPFPEPRFIIQDFNTWTLSSESAVQSLDINDHMTWIVDKISCKKPEISKIVQEGCEIKLYSSLTIPTELWGTDILIDDKILSFFAEIKCPLDFSIQWPKESGVDD